MKLRRMSRKPVLVEHAPDHGVEGVDAVLFRQIAAIGLAPAVEKLVGRKEGTGPVVHPVADHAEAVVFEKLRDVAFIAYGQLDIGIMDGGLFADGALELKDHQGQAVDIEDAVGDALFIAHDLKLVDHLVNVVAGPIGRRGSATTVATSPALGVRNAARSE